MNSKGLLLIGLDGATWKLLKNWISDGALPNLARLYNEGAKGTLLSTIPSTTSPAMPSLFTGKNPGNIGVLTFLNSSGEPVLADSYPGLKIWDVLGQNDLTSCVVDMRFTYPPSPINGVMTCSTPLPPKARELYFPPDLDKQLGRRVPLSLDYHGKIYRTGDFDKRKDEVLQHMRDYHEDRYQLISELKSKRHYDLVFTWFGDVDSIQHIYWHDKKAILEHFKTVDEYIGKLTRDFAGRDIMIISDHGFHKQPETRFYLNTWLMQNGLLDAKGNILTRWFYERIIRIYRKLIGYRKIRKWLGRQRAVDDAVAKEKTILRDLYLGIFPAIDWKTTKAYFFSEWAIRIIRENLDEDYEIFRSRLIEKMRDFVDSRGRHIFARVWKKEEVFTGRYLSQIPDVIYQLHEEYYPDPLMTSGTLYGKYFARMPYRMTGNHKHDREGIFIGYGPGFSSGQEIREAHIEDIAPTIYHLLDCPIPDDLDGKVIKEALSGKMKDKGPRYYTPGPVKRAGEGGTISRDEEESIKQQLKDMGYLSD